MAKTWVTNPTQQGSQRATNREKERIAANRISRERTELCRCCSRCARKARMTVASKWISRNYVRDQIGQHLPFTFCNEIDWFSVIQKLIWHS